MNTNQTLPTLMHYLFHWEATRPDAIFLSQPQPDGSVIDYSWRAVADEARRMASHLRALELPAKTSIAILGNNSAHWVMADLAIALAGHVSVPIYPSANASTISYVLEHSEARLVFVGRLDGDAFAQGGPAHLPRIRLPLAVDGEGELWETIVARTEALQSVELQSVDDLATIIYTSGTTGHPKGVMHRAGTMTTTPGGMSVLINGGKGLTPADRLISYLPMAHVAERAGVEASALCAGCSIYFNDGPEHFVRDLHRVRPTLLFSVPRLWTKFYQGVNQKIPAWFQRLAFNVPGLSTLLKKKILKELGLNQVHTAFTGSAALPVSIVQWYRSLGLELLEGCGMSENFGYAHFSRPGRIRVGYVGECNPGVECRIAEDGEILVKSPGQMLGYYKRPELMEDCYTVDGFFRTGDRGEIDQSGRLRLTGRVKELFKTSKGKYVAPVPLEMKLMGHAFVEDACVTGVGFPQPFALLTLSEDARRALDDGKDRNELAKDLALHLDLVNSQSEAHERLDRLVILASPWTVENGMLTPTLKVRRNVIEDHYQSRFEPWARTSERVVFDVVMQTPIKPSATFSRAS